MKKIRFGKIIACMLLFVSMSVLGKEETLAAYNPYPTTQDVDRDGLYEVPCTYFAWQQVYDNTGIALPGWGNAVNWWENAKSAGYATGSTPKPGAIAVWSGDYYGHVAYVTNGSGNWFTVNEGGRTDLDQTSSHGIAYGYSLTNAVGGRRPYDTNKILLGFIYPSEKASTSVTMSWGNYDCRPAQTDAYIYVRAMPSMSGTFTQNGITIWDSNGNVVKQKIDSINTTYSYLNIWYNITEELGIKLACGSNYKYQYWVVFNGKQYYSPVLELKTTGTHTGGSWKTTASPTCTKAGSKYRICSTCGHKQQATIAAKGHKKYNIVKKATTLVDGSVVTKCDTCKSTVSTKKLYSAKTVELSIGTYAYNGKTKKPAVTLKDRKGKVISASNYTVTYKNNKNVGKATVTVKCKGNYSGTLTKTFKIRPAVTSVSKVTAAKKAFTVKWQKKTEQVSGYEVMYATNSNFTKNKKTKKITNNKTVSLKVSGLKAKTKYYVKIRTYKTVNMVKYYSAWSKVKTITTK